MPLARPPHGRALVRAQICARERRCAADHRGRPGHGCVWNRAGGTTRSACSLLPHVRCSARGRRRSREGSGVGRDGVGHPKL